MKTILTPITRNGSLGAFSRGRSMQFASAPSHHTVGTCTDVASSFVKVAVIPAYATNDETQRTRPT
jgi:hypothetical protein